MRSLKTSNALRTVLDKFDDGNHRFLTLGALWLCGIAIDKNSETFSECIRMADNVAKLVSPVFHCADGRIIPPYDVAYIPL